MDEDRFVGDKIFEIGKRRGFFWQSYEIYGGVAGFYDLGPYGILLKNNIIDLWRRAFILKHQDLLYEIETPVIAPSRVFEASGHVESFTDPIVECTSCHRLFRADHLIMDKLGINVEGLSNEDITRIIKENNIRCPVCGGELGEVTSFNLLFKTQIGPYSGSTGYIRPETAQGMFVAFKRAFQVLRNRLPLGLAQIGRVARNEISPRQGMLRLREFTIMEFEFFFDPEEPRHEEYVKRVWDKPIRILTAEDKESGVKEPKQFTVGEAIETGVIKIPWMAYWMYRSSEFVNMIGVPLENQYFEEKLPEERAHYSKQTFDQLVKTKRWGWVEVSGHAYRGDYDLTRHMEYSGEDLRIYKQFPRPKIVESKEIRVDKARLGRLFGKKASEIMKEIRGMSLEELERRVTEDGGYIVADEKIPPGVLEIRSVTKKVSGKRFIPHVVEPSFGVERLVYIALEYGYHAKEDRIILSLPEQLAPIKVAVFPLVSHPDLIALAKDVYRTLLEDGYRVLYDEAGSIGRRYARADEIGVPYAITIDYDSLKDSTVTVRNRDNWRQIRIRISELKDFLEHKINI